MNMAIFAREAEVHVENSHSMAGTLNVSHA